MEDIVFNVFVNTTCCYVGDNVPDDCIQVSQADFDRLLRKELKWEDGQLVANE